MKRFARNAVLFFGILLVAQVVISLDYKLVRDLSTGKVEALRIGLPRPYEPAAEILAIQRHQRRHPRLGFLWKPDIDTADEVVVAWGDIPAGALCTDEYGFANSPEAIALRRDGAPVEIAGVGASYMGGAQGLFHEYLALQGRFYYSLAHGRFTLPQYNIALEQYALPMQPQWIVYGLNEVSFALIPDFEGWAASGLDWFEYHGGTWCGPPREAGFPHNVLRPYPRIHRLYQGLTKSLFPKGLPWQAPSPDELVDKTFEYVNGAYRTARAAGAHFVLLLIPSKQRMAHGPSPGLYLFERLLPRLREAGVPYIDLRESFSQAEDVEQLYFRFDGHWNRQGVYRAARELLDYIERHESG